MTDVQTERDVVDVLMTDHREVEAIFVELESRQGTPEHRRRLADVVIAELVRHAVAEEAYVYPTARKALPDGDQLAEHEIAEHSDAERTMKELESLDPSEPRFDELLTHLTATIRHHVQDEETDLFPRLRAACAREELVELAGKVEAAKKSAPTRPHPAAPDHPPANKLLAPGTGLVDRMRDALSGRPTSMQELREKN
ncbi:hemerythrin domain-containing protein [Micromonospora terminaliae]|uniref:Hemerythrin domain-containing protein n=1 Tax=Micromonospora terminaliae TaxID=1914461 RepID=A0AAJ2ZB25_9ACTN|nr:hemerythrin domain-containing protein [Micromonospora terminaliae]NES26413.1 hemerythrin domain-containing protein [Micromonospora terminaliae]QGL50591.1 hemerythrin domain-containing protein [Micromonospora terminaliae]